LGRPEDETLGWSGMFVVEPMRTFFAGVLGFDTDLRFLG
jgi:hypothetical protein